jgi:hypothetical protein
MSPRAEECKKALQVVRSLEFGLGFYRKPIRVENANYMARIYDAQPVKASSEVGYIAEVNEAPGLF